MCDELTRMTRSLVGVRHSSLTEIVSEELLPLSPELGSGSRLGVSVEDVRRLRVYEQLLGILYTHLL